jgi:hypothetical protein
MFGDFQLFNMLDSLIEVCNRSLLPFTSFFPTSIRSCFQFLQQFVPSRNFSKDQIKTLRPASSAVSIDASKARSLLAPLFGTSDFLPFEPSSSPIRAAATPNSGAKARAASAMSLSQLQSPKPAPPALPPWSSPDLVIGDRNAVADVDLTANGDFGDMSTAIEHEVSALLGDLTAVKAKAARAEAIAERLRQENGYLQQQVQLEMSSSHRSHTEQQRLQEQLRRSQSELDELRRQHESQQQCRLNMVAATAYDAIRDKAVSMMQRLQNFMRWRRVFKLWGQCRY